MTVFRVTLTSLLLTVVSFADSAVVKRNVTLRPGPTTDNHAITTLGPRQRVTVTSNRPRNGYLQVIVNGQKGWVWARNIDIDNSSSEESEEHVLVAKRDREGTDTCATVNNSSKHVGPARLYPALTKTPGCAATLDVDDLTRAWTENCPSGKETCTYSQSHRSVSSAERTAVYSAYDVPANKRNIENGEVDHFYPLCAGGSNSAGNLWYQPIDNGWNGKNFGFKEKDKLEAWICKQIKAHKLDPEDAFNRITADWVRFYIEQFLDDDDLKEQITDDESGGGKPERR
jgi:uncharacterized protein YraI